MDFSDFYKGFQDFKAFFTVKHMLTVLIVSALLLVVCAPQEPADHSECNDDSCPMPQVINVDPIVFTEVSQDNWRFDLTDEGWESRESDNPNIKIIKVNDSKQCKLFLLKDQTTDTFSQYVVDTIRGFTENLIRADSIRFFQINGNSYIGVLFLDDEEAIWVWMTTKDGFGYTFVCGCDSNAVGSEVCPAVAESLVIR